MATKKSSGSSPGRVKGATATSAKSTVGGPSRRDKRPDLGDAADQKLAGTQELVAAMPFNPNKAGEYGKAASKPQAGATVEPTDPRVTGSTLTEQQATPKVGQG